MSAVPNRNAATALAAVATALPPWMLTWMVVGFGFDIPYDITYWTSYIPYLASGAGSGEVVANSRSFALLRLDAILQGIPTIVLAIGLLAVFAPRGRGAIVERRLGLAARHRPIVTEIEDFLREHGATVEVRCNLARQDRLARIYPVGWRRARLAVFGPFAALWRRDRPAAQAVLLHEIAHVRTGDQLFLGLGSPFVALINLWFPLLVILGMIPLAGLVLTQYPTAGLLAGQLLLVLMLLPEALLLPVGALWLAELSADRYVADAGLRDGLLRSLDTNERRGGRYLAALARLSHPPRALRIWALRGGSGRDVALLACWPLLLLPLLLVTLAAAVPNLLLLGDSSQQLVESATRGSAGFLAYNRHTWIPAVALLLVWPAVARPWTRWWAGYTADRLSMPSRTHLVAAMLVAAVFLVLHLITLRLTTR